MNIKKILCFFVFLLSFGAMLMVLWHQGWYSKSFSSDEDSIPGSWLREYVNGKQVLYKVPDSFDDCEVIDELVDKWKEKDLDLAPGKLTRVWYLKTILVAHCIDYSEADTTDLVYSDITDSDDTTKKIIKVATDLWISNGYEDNGERVFLPNKEITKIEALALLFKLSKFQLKDEPVANNYKDVEDGWKTTVADKAAHLWIIHSNQVKKLFYPNEKMREWTTYKLLKELARYYR